LVENLDMRGVVAAGHPLTAEAGAAALRAGGNAVDAAVAAMLMSFVAEPLLTGLGAGGYMLVAPPGEDAVALDFIVAAPGIGGDPVPRAELTPVEVSFGEAVQPFNAGPASCGTYGNPAGVCTAHGRFGSLPLERLAAPAVQAAREGVALNAQQAWIFELLRPIVSLTEESRALYFVDGRFPREGDVLRNLDLARALERLAAEGPEPFYRGEIARRVAEWVAPLGSALTAHDLASYETAVRAPVRVDYRGREVLTNPPPSAGGILIAAALAALAGRPGPPALDFLIDVMEQVQGARTEAFVEGLDREGFADEFLSVRLGNTTHISAMDAEGWACTVTCTNGECSGVVVPGTGIHLNNMMGEEDLNPLGFFRHTPGRRLPSMMSPTIVRRDGRPELVLGSAGSNRIRSAITQMVVNVIDHGMSVEDAVAAPRVHWEDGVLYAEPGLEVGDREAMRFAALNIFFGGVQAVQVVGGELHGAADPRRGGAAIVVE
jgi:gamma-glutamyltranspeptidase / glutathione hydrolase